MGTEITLDIGGLQLTYSKNSIGFDHGALYQEQDRKLLPCEQLNYEYCAEHGIDPSPSEMALCRRLRDMVPRLELMGFTLEQAKEDYERAAASWRENQSFIAEYYKKPVPETMAFAQFLEGVTAHAPCRFHGALAMDDGGLTELGAQPSPDGPAAPSAGGYIGELIGAMHPYAALRLLAERPTNLDTEVIWHYGALVDSGWAEASDFQPGARRGDTFLIATEGSSDAHILKHAFDLFRPEMADFFRYIDVSDRHPFPGTGNLLKFAEGLVKIDVQNRILFLFDNDAEGLDAYRRLSRLTLPANMRGMVLPDLEAFRSFPVRGPEGMGFADINGRAAAIECYLDLAGSHHAPAAVIWTNYKPELDVYQGALEHKETYTRHFLRQTPETLAATSYGTSRIRAVLDALVVACSAIATADEQSTT